MAYIPGEPWRNLKKELITRWSELTEEDLEGTRGESRSVIELLENKLGMAFDEASQKFSEMASRYKLYDEPKEAPTDATDKRERILELRPKAPARRDPKPKDPSTSP